MNKLALVQAIAAGESLYAVSAELAQRIEREMLSTGRHQGGRGVSLPV